MKNKAHSDQVLASVISYQCLHFCFLGNSIRPNSVSHSQKWSTDLPGYRIGIPICIALKI